MSVVVRAAIAALLLLPALPAAAAPPLVAKDDSGEDQFIVLFKPGTAERHRPVARDAMLEELGRAHGVRLRHVRRMSFDADVVHADHPLPRGQAEALLRRLRNDPRVEIAQVDHRVTIASNDPRWGEQWAYAAPPGINLAAAWGRSRGAGIVVAVVDTGITAHPDLDANMLTAQGYDFVSDVNNGDGDGRDASPLDPGDWEVAGECKAGSKAANSSWHGTHVAGTVAALADNNEGGAGVAPDAKVLPVRVLGKCGGRDSDIADAIRWAAGIAVTGVPANTRPAHVINLSLGSRHSCDALTQLAIDSAVERGAVVVVAAGNDALDVAGASPASCDNVIAVAAVAPNGRRAGYSNFGSRIDIAAPGGGYEGEGQILSTINPGTQGPLAATSQNGYGLKGGTSMAAPHVAGTVALMQAIRKRAPADVERVLKLASRPPPYCPQKCGEGSLDAERATIGANPFMYLADYVTMREADFDRRHPVTLRLSDPVDHAVTFDFDTADRDATQGIDYNALHYDGLTIPAGQTSKPLTLLVRGDDDIEYDEFIALNTSNVVGVPMLHPNAMAVIPNDDGASAWLSDNEGIEGGTIRIGVHLSQALPNDEFFRLWVNPGSARHPDDFTYGSVQGYIPAGKTRHDFVLNVIADGAADGEKDEFFDVHLDGVATAIAFNPANDFEAVGTIKSKAKPTLDLGNANIVEGGAGGQRMAVFSATLSRPMLAALTFQVAFANGSAKAGEDYTSVPGTVTIPKGAMSASFSVPVQGDDAPELHEWFLASIVGDPPNVEVGRRQGVGTVFNDDQRYVWIEDAQVIEGDDGSQSMRFFVHLSEESTAPVTFTLDTRADFNARAGTPATGGDFVARTGVQDSIPAGMRVKPFDVVVWGDRTAESNERFQVVLSAVSGAVLRTGAATDDVADGFIWDNDGTTLRLHDAEVLEGHSGSAALAFQVKLSKAVSTDVSFTATTSPFSPSPHLTWPYSTSPVAATVGTDYSALTNVPVTIPAGQTEAWLTVPVHGDTDDEVSELLYLTLGNPVGAGFERKQAIGRIVDDEGAVLTLEGAGAAEGNAGSKQLVFQARLLTPSPTSPVRFNVFSTDGTALASDGDYVALPPTGLWIPGGTSSKVFTAVVNGDTKDEPDESFYLNLGDVQNAEVFGGKLMVAIANDDPPSLTIGDVSIGEGGGTARFKVRLSRAATSQVTFNIGTVANSAQANVDYTTRSLIGQKLLPGEIEREFAVAIVADAVVEPTEAFFVAVSSVVGATVVDGNARGTILDDD